MNQYDQFSTDYHWLYSDGVLAGKPFLEEFGSLLNSIPSGSKILDCSCGIGVHAIALAKRGFSVYGTDYSPGMVEQAKERSISADIKIPFSVSAWNELPQKLDQLFDVTFCLGNSVGHCRNKVEMISSFQGIRAILKKEGLLVLDSRNWEKLQRVKPRFSTTGSRSRNGIRCIPLYVWNFPDRFEDEHLIEVVFLFENQNSVYERHYNITYHPFRHSELCEILSEVGFVNIRSDFTEEKDLYTITAQAG